jgi:hypothetical protein
MPRGAESTTVLTDAGRFSGTLLAECDAWVRPASLDGRYSSYERSRIAITLVQLVHVDRILQDRGTRCSREFLKTLDERTPILGFFKWRWDTWARRNGQSATAIAPERECFLQCLSQTVATLYADGAAPDWRTTITAFLQEKHEELDTMFGTYEQQYRHNTREWKSVGAIQVTPPQPLGQVFERYPRLIEGLARHGLTCGMPTIQVHVPTRFTQGESPWEAGRTILQLARHLRAIDRDYEPLGVRALFGLSWQFDSVLGRRLGFTVVDSPDLPQNIMGAWYQLMNEDGSFNRKRLAHLLEHNELPYRLKCGFLRVPNQRRTELASRHA